MAAAAALLSLCFGVLAPCPHGGGPRCSGVLATGVNDPKRIAVSHDDTLVAVAASSGLHVYNAATGVALTVPSYPSGVMDVAFSPDATTVAVALEDKGVAVVSLSTGKEVWSDTSHGKYAYCVAYSQDGTRVACGFSGGSISTWDAATGGFVLSLTGGHTQTPYGLKYTPDGARLVSGSFDDRVVVWNATTAEVLKTLTHHNGNVYDIQMSPDGLYFASVGYYDYDTLNIYKLSDYSLHKQIPKGHRTRGMSFSQDWSKVAMVYQDMKVYSVETGVMLQAYAMPTSWTYAVSYFHTSDIIVTGGRADSSDILLWDVPTLATPLPPAPPSPPTPAPPAPSPPTLTPCPTDAGPQCSGVLTKGVVYPNRIAVSHDDTLVAVAASSGLHVYNVATGAALTVPSYSSTASDVAFSPDAITVVVGFRGHGIVVVSLITGMEVWSDTSKSSYCDSVAYSPDGTRVACGYSAGSIYIWDAATGGLVLPLTAGHADGVTALKYTPDGARLISVSDDRRVIVWDSKTGAVIRTLADHTGFLNAVQVSPDGLYFASMGYYDYDTLNIYKLSDYSLHKQIPKGHTTRGMSFSQDWSKVATVQQDMKVYSVETGVLLQAYSMPTSWTDAVAYFHTSDAIVTGGRSSNVDLLLWDAPPPPTYSPSTAVPETPAPVTPSPPTSSPPTPAPATPAPPTPAPPTSSPPTPAPATPSPPTPTPPTSAPHSCEASDTIATVCRASQRCVLRIQHAGSVLSVAHSPDGEQIAAGGADGVVRVFSAATGAQLRSLACGGFAAHDVAFSPDGTRVAAGGVGGRAVVCDATTGAVLLDLEQGGAAAAPVRRVRFSPDGRLLVAGGVEEGVTRVHDAVGGMPSGQELPRHVRGVAFLPAGAGSGSGPRLAAVTVHAEAGEAVRVFAMDNGQEEAAVVSVGARVTALSFSPGGDELARGMDDATVRVGLWAGNATSERLRLTHRSGFLLDVHHSPDGRLVVGAGSGPVVVWGTSGGATLAVLVGHAGGVHRLSFSPSGTRVATAGHDGQLLVWDVSGL